eukprot:snap_masked-scaffold_111-processed-gene-0.4-mRNA-1 protein AED:1.00 eAED:1.00 QI:0/-1/0/0/-1/1/1/0/70
MDKRQEKLSGRKLVRSIKVSAIRTIYRGETVHHTPSGDQVSNLIIDTGADESAASLQRHSSLIEDVRNAS